MYSASVLSKVFLRYPEDSKHAATVCYPSKSGSGVGMHHVYIDNIRLQALQRPLTARWTLAAWPDKKLSVDKISIQPSKIDYANTESNNQGV